jgi:hypothetical protein
VVLILVVVLLVRLRVLEGHGVGYVRDPVLWGVGLAIWVLGLGLAVWARMVNVALANSWIVINSGGGPTDDKPTVILETPRDPDRVSSFLNIRVKDIDAVYAEWSARGAEFLTLPKQHP